MEKLDVSEFPVAQFEEEKECEVLTKTDRILSVILTLTLKPNHWVTADELFKLLGDPSRAQKYKTLTELCTAKSYRPAILKKVMLEDRMVYKLDEGFYGLLRGGVV
jgi:hypothetical protein